MENIFDVCAPPAYAYCNPSFGGDMDEDDDGVLSPVVYNYLESIAEETSDDLRSEESRSDVSERWGWDCSSTDAASVIHVEKEKDGKEVNLQEIPRCVNKAEQLDRWLEESISRGRFGGSGSVDLECPSTGELASFSPGGVTTHQLQKCEKLDKYQKVENSTGRQVEPEGEMLILIDAPHKDAICEWNKALDEYMNGMTSSWDKVSFGLKRSASLDDVTLGDDRWSDDIVGDKFEEFSSREAPPKFTLETRGSPSPQSPRGQWSNPATYDQSVVASDFDLRVDGESCSSSSDEEEINLRTRFVCQDLTQISKLDAEEGSDCEGESFPHYECINELVNCDMVKSRSLTDLRCLNDVLQLVEPIESRRSIKNESDTKTRPSSENLSEDSGYNDEFGKYFYEEEKKYKIDVIFEEEEQTTKNITRSQCVKVTTCCNHVTDPPIDKRNFDDSSGDFYTNNCTWQDELMQSEWERSVQSGRATTDDYLFLKLDTTVENFTTTKPSRSLPTLTHSTDSEDASDSQECVLSAPASMVPANPRFTTPLWIEEENNSQVHNNRNNINNLQFQSLLINRVQDKKSRDFTSVGETSTGSSNCTGVEPVAQGDMRLHEGAHRKLTVPNWERDAARLDVTLDLAGGQQLPRQSSVEESKTRASKSSPELSRDQPRVSTEFGRQLSREFGRLSFKVNLQQRDNAMFNSRPQSRGTIPTVPYVPPRSPSPTKPEMVVSSNSPTNGHDYSQVERVQVRYVEPEPQRSIAVHSPHSAASDVDAASPSNGRHGSGHTNNTRNSSDTAAKALEESYRQLEKAITCLQQDIDDHHAFYLHSEPEVSGGSVCGHTSQTREEYFEGGEKEKAEDRCVAGGDINQVFDELRKRAQEGRERVARSVLDLNEIERSVRDEIDRVTSSTQATTTAAPSAPPRHRRSGERARGPLTNGRASPRSRSTGYLETDIDTLQSRQVVLDVDNEFIARPPTLAPAAKAFSMLSLRRPHEEGDDAERARSMEFLLDAENKVAAQPPENQLMHGDGRAISEHELRVRRSLQRLDVPEWFKNSPYSQAGGFLLKKKREEDGSQERWLGLTSRTPSASSVASVASCRHVASTTPTTTTSGAITRMLPPYCWRYPGRWSKESLQSPGSPSPSPLQEKSQYFTRWGSVSTSPSPTGSLQRPTPLLTRQPYLGWRSSERLTREVSSAESTPTHTTSNFYRSAAERLSAGPGYYALRYGSYGNKPSSEGSLLSARKAISAGPSPTEPLMSALKRSPMSPSAKPPIPPKPTMSPTTGIYRSVVQQNGKMEEECPKSPRQRVGWMESSFVGLKPNKDGRKDSYEECPRGSTPSPARSGHNSDDDSRLSKAKRSFGQVRYDEENQSRDSGSSVAGLEEVLDSLLAIPSSSRSVSPASRSRFYFGDDSDSDARGSSTSPSRRTSSHLEVTDDTDPKLHGPISDHLLATSFQIRTADQMSAQPQVDDVDAESDGNNRSTDRQPRPPTPPPRPLVSGESDVHQLHVHWGPDAASPPLPVATTDAVKARRGSEQLRNLLPDDLLVRCSFPRCAKTVEWVEARRSFKTCHNCYTYYCSRECRRLHWEKHRKTCMYSRIRSLCKHVILRSKDDPSVQAHLTKLARTGTVTQGRGFVKLGFRNPELVERFLRQGWSALEDNPIYVAWRDLLPQELGPEVFHEVCEMCKQYNPEYKFVLLAVVYVTREIPEQPVPRWEREVIAKCAKVPLRKPTPEDDEILDPSLEPDTLILTAVPQPSDMSPKKARELCLHNIQRHLRQRGVSLKHQFPEVFDMLTLYVDQSQPFPPITIYPKDGRTGKTFMCLIMPNTEPEIEQMVTDFSRK